MATVKEFRDLGVPFVAGDKCRDAIFVFAEVWYVYGNANDDSFDICKVTHFAWRPLNTLPDNPRFKCELDYSKAEIKWRPLLDQSDSKVGEPTKPVFTQAMADVGELPPVGSECFLCLSFDTYKAKITYLGDGVGCFINLADNKEFTFSVLNAEFKPLDTRTPKQKAVDEAEKVITNKVPTVSIALAKRL